MNLSLLILLAVFVVIAARKIGRVPVKIWHAMTAGAVLVLVTGRISLPGAMQELSRTQTDSTFKRDDVLRKGYGVSARR